MNNLYDEKNRLTVSLDTSIEENIKVLDMLFKGCGDVVQKSFFIDSFFGNNTEKRTASRMDNYGVRQKRKVKIHLIYIDGLTDNQMIEQTIIKPILYEWQQIDLNLNTVQKSLDNNYFKNDNVKDKKTINDKNNHDLWNRIFYMEAQTVDIKEEASFDKTVEAVLNGDTAMFVDGYAKTFIISSKKYPLRSITENDTEAGIRGP
ncbi:MAG: spore germination protein, partial [Lachnospiraceae bacterium]|nr:spore germination protein [Lachnospiraceae bacterium]